MQSHLRAWWVEITAKLRSKRWRSAFLLALAWWLADSRWELGDRANQVLDDWAIPVIPELIRRLLLPVVVIVGFILVLIAHAYLMSFRSQQALRGSAVGDTLEAYGIVTAPQPEREPKESNSQHNNNLRSQLEALLAEGEALVTKLPAPDLFGTKSTAYVLMHGSPEQVIGFWEDGCKGTAPQLSVVVSQVQFRAACA